MRQPPAVLKLNPNIAAFRQNYQLTDCGNAERLVDQHGESIRFCPPTREWLTWNGFRWVADRGAVVQLAKKTIRAVQQERSLLFRQAELGELGGDILRARADALARWATRSEGVSRIAGMLSLAESDPRIVAHTADFDSDPWLFNLRNGTVELRGLRVRPHRLEDLLTKTAGVEYDADATCPRWERFLQEVFAPHPTLIPFIQRAVGYTLTGDTREECIFVLEGRGRNGKSTFLKILHDVLGEYGGLAEIEAFMSCRSGGMREDIADMRGRRLVSAQEPSISGSFAESTLKWVSGGDQLRARRLWEHAQEFHPTHKLWLAVNRLPSLRLDDVAAWSRLRIIPFEVSFARSPNRGLKSELRAELSGILNWALRGCHQWQQSGLGTVDAIEKAVHAHIGRKVHLYEPLQSSIGPTSIGRALLS